MTTAKKGKLPIKKKNTLNSDFDASPSRNRSMVDLDPVLAERLQKEGYNHRWMNRKNYVDQGNFHRSGWQAYRLPEDLKKGSLDFQFGVSPEGYVIRGDLVLGVQPKASFEAHKRRIQAKTRAQSGDQVKEAALALKQIVGDSASVIEGYDANGEDGDE